MNPQTKAPISFRPLMRYVCFCVCILTVVPTTNLSGPCVPPQGHEDAELEAPPGLGHHGRGAGRPGAYRPHRVAHPRRHYPALPGQESVHARTHAKRHTLTHPQTHRETSSPTVTKRHTQRRTHGHKHTYSHTETHTRKQTHKHSHKHTHTVTETQTHTGNPCHGVKPN